MSWPRAVLAALMFVVAGFSFAMGVDGLTGVQPGLAQFVAAALLGVVALIGLAMQIHERPRRKEDR
jgi:hypothetical protein